jgi:hypothetical protein
MRVVEIFRLRRVRDKPRALAVLADAAALAPDEALALIHAAVGGGRPVFGVPNDDTARAAICALAQAGFVARFAAVPGFDAPRVAHVAVLRVQGRLTQAVRDAAGALLLADDWAGALDLAVQHLRHHVPADDADRAWLERTAIEVGLVAGVPGRV